MAPQFTSSACRLSGGARARLAVLFFWALAVPLMYLSQSSAAPTDDPEDPFAPAPATQVVDREAPEEPIAAEAAPAATTPAPLSRTPALQGDDSKTSPPRWAHIDPAAEFLPPLTAAEKRITAELQDETTMDFQETPLQGVVEYLKDLHGIEVQLDEKALKDGKTDPETQVTATLKGITLRSAY